MPSELDAPIAQSRFFFNPDFPFGKSELQITTSTLARPARKRGSFAKLRIARFVAQQSRMQAFAARFLP
jgi:hypothetical protein